MINLKLHCRLIKLEAKYHYLLWRNEKLRRENERIKRYYSTLLEKGVKNG